MHRQRALHFGSSEANMAMSDQDVPVGKHGVVRIPVVHPWALEPYVAIKYMMLVTMCEQLHWETSLPL